MSRHILAGLLVGLVLSLFLTRPLVGTGTCQTRCQGSGVLAEDADPNGPPEGAE